MSTLVTSVLVALSPGAVATGVTGKEHVMASEMTIQQESAAGRLSPRFVELPSGIRLEYVEHGHPNGVPVIFLHGVTDSWRSFEQVLPLLPSSIRALALSQRGHGESSRPEGGYRFHDFAADVHGFMDVMGLRRAVLVGHSMGASVAQRMMADHPERLIAVVLMGAFAGFEGNAELGEYVRSAILPLADPISRDFAREWQSSTLARPIAPAQLETFVSETLKVPAHVWHQAFSGFLTTPDFLGELQRAEVPVLLLWGDRDTYALRRDQDRLLAAMPTARLVVYENTGHALHWEAPARVAGELGNFLGSEK